MFFGTPHDGPNLPQFFGNICSSIVRSISENSQNDVIDALTQGSLFSDILQDRFKHQLEDYKIVSFYEGIGNVGAARIRRFSPKLTVHLAG